MSNTYDQPAAAIFDMDGLMLDTEKPVIDMWIKAGKSLGYDISRELIIRTLGIDGPGTRAVFMKEFGPEFPYDKIREKHHELYALEFDERVDLKPGLITLLDHLAALNIPVTVATSSRRGSAEWKLRTAGILDRFPVITCGDEVARGKPAPDIFLLAAERIRQPPALCVGFEDSPAGLMGLHAAGIRSVFIKDIVEPPPEVLATVWKRYENLAEAVELFE